MPGQRVKADLVKHIVALKSNGVSNRAIASTFNVNRNTVNNYIKLCKEGLLDDQFKVKNTRSFIDEGRLLEFCDFVKRETNVLNSSSLWREYKSTHENGYGYTHFCNLLNYLEVSITLGKTTPSPVLFSGKVKDGVLNKETGEIKPAFVICLLFPSSGLHITSKYTELDIDSIINFLELSFRNLNGRPYQLALHPYSFLRAKFKTKTIDTLSDWLSLHDIKSIIPPEGSMTEELRKTIDKSWSTICKMGEATNESDSLIESNFTEKLSFGLSRSILFSAFDRSSLSELPLSFAGARKTISARVQKMSHLFLPEDKNYYSVPSKYIGQDLTLKYCVETVTIYQEDLIICVHKRSTTPYKYTTNKQHLKAGKGWTQDYFTKIALRCGPSTKSFIQKLFGKYDSPNAGFKQANAIIHLRAIYSDEAIELACHNLLKDGAATYHRLKRDLELGSTL
jgi:transposase